MVKTVERSLQLSAGLTLGGVHMYLKEIIYDRETRSFALYLDGQLVGYANNYHEADSMLDQLIFQIQSGQYFKSPEET